MSEPLGRFDVFSTCPHCGVCWLFSSIEVLGRPPLVGHCLCGWWRLQPSDMTVEQVQQPADRHDPE